jgi:hypothetical protein
MDEDPEGWAVGVHGSLWHGRCNYWIEFDHTGPVTINGFALGWWRRFVLRHAVWRWQGARVDAYLAERDRIETERLLAS